MRAGLGADPRTQPVERGGATDVAVRVTVSDLLLRAGGLAGYRVTAEFLHAGTRFGTCGMVVGRPSAPGPMPGDLLPAGLLHPPSAAVGSATEADVLVARAPQGRLVVLPRDPVTGCCFPGAPASSHCWRSWNPDGRRRCCTSGRRRRP
ncbi:MULTISPECIES: hypothetical protein [Streptomyces]|uniref:Uncharacterized protein n=1 Tax=Streptomyces bobili TaxID=67280 RepID=A0ABZ1QR30_9ACTN|nr:MULTISPECIES: hypothetical protein [Streptomyces]GGW77197.1 hypothetical protein GCM10010350_72760 [Streptomyces galilaeus]